MARFAAEDIENYGGNAGGGFFSLKDDKDTAVVRFMYNDAADIVGHAVHEVEVDGRKRYVNCLRSYNQPVDDCPLCAARIPVKAKFFVPLFDEESGEIKIWDRGRNFLSKLTSLCGRYNPLVSTPFEIERNGKKGDQHTTYETYALETDDTTLEDLPEVPDPIGTIILDKTFDELAEYVDTGAFPKNEPEARNEEPVRRRQSGVTSSRNNRPAERSNTLRRGSDKF